jgi:UPF0176 protein
MFTVSLYYLFRPISDPVALVEAQKELCEELGLKGRIYIAEEGINGTCAGTPEAVEEYQRRTEEQLDGASIHWKDDGVERIPFARLQVKKRPYLVNMGEDSLLDPKEEGGEYLSPSAWKEMLEERDDYVLLDVRNDYEAIVGRFDGAEIAPYSNFSEFAEWVDELDADPDKPILMYCTGGIRCEKFSGIVKRKGFHNVYQLEGGILGYANEQGGEHFKGKCFVFDDRMVVDIGGEEDDMARCIHCGEPTTSYHNCANMDCHRLMLCCDACAMEYAGCCSDECIEAPRRRVFKEEHLHRPYRKQSEEEVTNGRNEGPSP